MLTVMDKKLVRERFSRALNTYDGNAGVQRKVAEKLCDRVMTCCGGQAGRVLEIGCGTGCLSRLLFDWIHPEQMWLNDLCAEAEPALNDLLSRGGRFLPGDAEKISFPDGLDMIVSSSAIQWFDDLPAFFRKCHEALYPSADGYLVFSTFGKDNLAETAFLTGASLRYFSLEELTEMLSPGFEVIYSSEERVMVAFDSPFSVLRHLKMTGVTGVSGTGLWTRGRLEEFSRRYIELFPVGAVDPSSAVRLTYHPVYFVCRRKKV